MTTNTTAEVSEAMVEAGARKLLERGGFGYYADPMEGGQDAYDLTREACEDALSIYLAMQSERLKGDENESYEIGKRDGYEAAVQDIDLLTGGDGEYRYCTNHDPEQHCPDPETMKARIVGCLKGDGESGSYFVAMKAASDEIERLREALAEIAKGEGPFNRDPFIHAENTIDSMKEIALAALAGQTSDD